MPETIHGQAVPERYYDKAKDIAARAGRTGDWAYIMGIVKRMMGIDQVKKSPDDLFRSLAYEDRFTVWTPACLEFGSDLTKSTINRRVIESYKRPDFLDQYGTSRPIGGYTSTERLDRQEEQLLAKGLDFRECVQYGWYNDNHVQDTAAVVGIPTLIELHDTDLGPRWFAKGYLLEDYPRATAIWQLAKSLRKVGRKLGYSVEGKVTDRDGPVVIKAIIRNIAVTANPVNTDCTWDVLTKAMRGHADYIKALVTSHYAPPSIGSGVMVDQELDSQPKRLIYSCPQCKEIFETPEDLLNHHNDTGHDGAVKKAGSYLSEAQAVRWVLDRHPVYGEQLAHGIVKHAMKQKRRLSNA